MPQPANVVFLLSPARCAGKRADLLLDPRAQFELAAALRSAGGAALGDVFAFLSSLYFRGKLAYAQRFTAPPARDAGAVVIAPGRGLCDCAQRVSAADIREMARVEVDARNPAFVEPLVRDALAFAERESPRCRFVLLGSIASSKYVGPLLDVFGERLLFPSEFVGRGDMSRGGLMLRCAHAGHELEYTQVANAVRRGPRAAKLASLSWMPPAAPRVRAQR